MARERYLTGRLHLFPFPVHFLLCGILPMESEPFKLEHAASLRPLCSACWDRSPLVIIKLNHHLMWICIFIQWEVTGICISAAFSITKKQSCNYFSGHGVVSLENVNTLRTLLLHPYLQLLYTCSQICIACTCPMSQERKIFLASVRISPCFSKHSYQI